jgi:hypothetical protein
MVVEAGNDEQRFISCPEQHRGERIQIISKHTLRSSSPDVLLCTEYSPLLHLVILNVVKNLTLFVILSIGEGSQLSDPSPHFVRFRMTTCKYYRISASKPIFNNLLFRNP